MMTLSHDESSTRWLVKTCRLLVNDEFPPDITLSFDGAGFGEYAGSDALSVFLEAIRSWGKATRLTFKNIALDPKSKHLLEQAFDANPDLDRLKLVNVTSDDQDIQFLSRSLFSANKKITELTLDSCEMRQKDGHLIQRLLGGGSMVSLQLHNMVLVDSLTRISPRLSHDNTLQNLDFSKCELSHKALSCLFASLCSNTTLESLVLDSCGIGPAHLDDVCNLLSKNKRLTTLSLGSNEVNASMVETWVEHGLRDNTSLRKLVLSNNPIGDEGAIKLAQLLVSNSSLRSLSLMDCRIGQSGCHALAAGLAEMAGIRELYVNGEMESEATTVLESLQHNMTVKYLWTDRRTYLVRDDRQWRLVEFYLRLNRGKRRILTEPSVPESILPLILEGLSGDPRLVHYMLKQTAGHIGRATEQREPECNDTNTAE